MRYFLIILFAFLLSVISAHAKNRILMLYYPPTGKIVSERRLELSGMASATHKGEYWGHDDSGNSIQVYRFNHSGQILQSVALKGAQNIDWEDMTGDGEGNYYIADAGDNLFWRKTYQIYHFVEPPENESGNWDCTCYSFQYEDGRSYDCEAFFILNGKFYLIEKMSIVTDSKPKIFCIDTLEKGKILTAKAIGPLNIKRKVTGAEYSPRHNVLAVLTYSCVVFYDVKEESNLLTPPLLYTVGLFYGSEALCFDGDDLVITNERGEIWKHSLKVYLER